MKKFWQEFKDFISKGNVIDLAIGVVVGTAFSKIVTSLVNDIIMPLFGALLGQNSFSDLKWVIRTATETTAELALRYGAFIQSMIDFFIIAFSVFIALKFMMRSQKKLKEASQNILEDLKKLTRKQKKELKQKSNELDKKVADTKAELQTKTEQKVEVKSEESVEDILRDIRNALKK